MSIDIDIRVKICYNVFVTYKIKKGVLCTMVKYYEYRKIIR